MQASTVALTASKHSGSSEVTANTQHKQNFEAFQQRPQKDTIAFWSAWPKVLLIRVALEWEPEVSPWNAAGFATIIAYEGILGLTMYETGCAYGIAMKATKRSACAVKTFFAILEPYAVTDSFAYRADGMGSLALALRSAYRTQ